MKKKTVPKMIKGLYVTETPEGTFSGPCELNPSTGQLWPIRPHFPLSITFKTKRSKFSVCLSCYRSILKDSVCTDPNCPSHKSKATK
jgi:hypothetical protein